MTRRILIGLLLLAAAFALWEALVVALHVPDYLVPPPTAVLATAAQRWRVLAADAGLTLGSAAVGLLISTLFALGCALWFSVSEMATQAAMPLLLVFRSAPVAAVAPLITLFLGRGVATSVAVVTIVSFFPLLINLMRGLRSASPQMLELLHVYGASTWTQLRVVRIPFALPYFFTGLRIAGASAILGTMLSEWITGARGLGKLILDTGEMRETEMLWAAVLTSIAAALLVFALTSMGESRAMRWKGAGSTLSGQG